MSEALATAEPMTGIPQSDVTESSHLLKLQDAVMRLKLLDYARLQEEIGTFCAESFVADAPTCKCQCSG
jgi:hypothetical protein